MKTIISTCFAASLLASPMGAAPVQWTVASGGNDHWYEYVDVNTDWDSAAALAAGMTHLGASGYLATITSAAEQLFLNTINSHIAWLGGSDRASEGNWEWVTEPGGSVALSYTNWSGGEPNNCCGGENYLVGWWFGDTWNDLRPNDTWGAGMLVEYSPAAVPLPASLPLLGAALGAVALIRRRRKTV